MTDLESRTKLTQPLVSNIGRFYAAAELSSSEEKNPRRAGAAQAPPQLSGGSHWPRQSLGGSMGEPWPKEEGGVSGWKKGERGGRTRILNRKQNRKLGEGGKANDGNEWMDEKVEVEYEQVVDN